MLKTRAAYEYEINHELKSIAITDMKVGMSVTNDIEKVVAEIGVKNNIDASQYAIVYRDTDDIWDGVRIENGVAQFYSLHSLTMKEAIDKAVNKLTQRVRKNATDESSPS